MAWTTSKVFVAFVTARNNGTNATNLSSDTIEGALFDGTITPDATVSLANSAYGVGVWSSGHVTDTGSSAPAGWPTLGRPLTSVTSAATSNVYSLGAANLLSANGVTTITNANGLLVYDHTVAGDYGVCFLYFGGAQTITLGTVTVAFSGGNLVQETV